MSAQRRNQDPTSTDVQMWKPDDVAEYLQIKPSGVREMARLGRIPSHKIGNQWRFYPSEIRRWAQRQ